MPILDDLTDRNAVLRAIAEFEDVGRDEFLRRYGFGRNSDYFVVTENGAYDAKAIAGAAYFYQHGTALLAASFRGGDKTVGEPLERLGFEVDAPWDLPDWTRDELLLALDLYVKTTGKTGLGRQAKAVIELSQEIRALSIFSPGIRKNPRFRNPNGVSLKLDNFKSVDTARPGKGMEHIAKADKVVFGEWAHRPVELADLVAAIREGSTYTEADIGTGEPEEDEADEGRLLYRLHRTRERNPGLVRKKKAAVLKKLGRLACEVCDFESAVFYGDGVEDVIDVHHVVPLHRIGESTTRLSDLALVCPNCHRAIHKHKPFVTPAELKAKRDAI